MSTTTASQTATNKRSQDAAAARPAGGETAATPGARAGLPLFLQSTLTGLLPPTIQHKLEVNQPGDAFEQEADKVADQVTRVPQSQPRDSEDPQHGLRPARNLIQRSPAGANGAATSSSGGSTTSQRGRAGGSPSGGAPLSSRVRGRVEPLLGRDLGHVRVHTDETAHAATEGLHSRAFTHGNHIWLGEGEDSDDVSLMAHEATHVAQQEEAEDSHPPLIQRDEKPGAPPDTTTSPGSAATPTVDGPHKPSPDSGTGVGDPSGTDKAPANAKKPADGAPGEPEAGTPSAPTPQGAEKNSDDEPSDNAPGDGADGVNTDEADADGAAQDSSALIDEELAEHERWAGSFGEMGTAGSDQRAQFLLDQAGQGVTTGAVSGAGMGFVMGAIGAAIGKVVGQRLATMAVSRGFAATPVPGLGPAIGGVMAVAGLVMRDWGSTAKTIGKIGEGEGYEGLANTLEGIAEILDVACSVMDVLAGVLGGIAVGMWVGAVLSAGVLSPLAASLSAIALGINAATTAIGLIINIGVRPTVVALRALHAFQSQGNPAQIEAEGQVLQGAAGQISGAVAGAAAGKLGGAVGGRLGTHIDKGITKIQQTRTGGRASMSAKAGPGPRVHLEVPEAPKKTAGDAGASPAVTAGEGTTTAKPAAADGAAMATPAAATPGASPVAAASPHPPESFADLDPVIADLNADPTVTGKLTDNRTHAQAKATPYKTGEAREYGNKQAAAHRDATGMSGAEVQAGHTAAARHAKESNIDPAAWDKQQWMDLHSRKGKGLDVKVTDQAGKERTRTRHTSQELLIDQAVETSKKATGGTLTPQGQLDAAALVAWQTQNTPYRQQDVDAVRGSAPAAPGKGPAVDPATGRVIKPAGSGSGVATPAAGSAAATPRSSYASHTETLKTTDRSAAMAQYHDQVRSDPGRESAVWRGADGHYYVLQGDGTGVRRPTSGGPFEIVYHSHPTDTDTMMQGVSSQPSQAKGDVGVLQQQHGQGPVGKKQTSELHFPVYDDAGNHTGYGATRFAYDPTNPLPLQVQTTLPGGKTTTQRYASFQDFQNRTGIMAGGATREASAAATAAADVKLGQDQAGAKQRTDETAKTLIGPGRTIGVREGREAGRQEIAAGAEGAESLAGPAYTATIAGLKPGESIEIPINPAYPEPPGTPEELEALRSKVHDSQAAQQELENTELKMGAQAAQQQKHEEQLGEAKDVAKGLADGRDKHDGTVDATQDTNTSQQKSAGEAISSLGQGAKEGAALVTLCGSLRVFQGMAHLFSYLPGELGHKAENARNDAGELITTLGRASDTEKVQANVVGERGVMENDAQRIQKVKSSGETTDKELQDGQKKIDQLDAANADRLAETQGTQQQATQEKLAAGNTEQEAQASHDDLQSRLQEWAQTHRQVRENAIASATASYKEMGYDVTPQE